MGGPQSLQGADTDVVVGIDSDGCVFDTMEIKQKRCFHPLIVRHWQLAAIEAQVREVAEFVNLYSRWRGQNRFVALLQTFEWLTARTDLPADHPPLPPLTALRAYMHSGQPLSNANLAATVDRTADPELRRVLDWSLAVDEHIQRVVHALPPFDAARSAIARLAESATVVVVSQTPTAALVREWAASGLQSYIQSIAGQEQGTKSEILHTLQQTHGTSARLLMIGDAPGDWQAAQAARAAFYPIMPGDEDASWQHLQTEAYPRFLKGTFDHAYQQQWVQKFEHRLPDQPPAHWFTTATGS